MAKCQLDVAPFFQCCCNCRHHWKDTHQCTLNPRLRKKLGDKCICSEPKGWICVGFRFQGDGSESVHSGWPEHSVGCEMYTPIKQTRGPKGSAPSAGHDDAGAVTAQADPHQ